MADNESIATIMSRKEARKLGLKYYFIGPCMHGHLSGRFTSTGDCRGCRLESERKWRAKTPQRLEKARNNYYKDHEKSKLECRLRNRIKRAKQTPSERENEKARCREWARSNSYRHKENAKRWRALNPEKVRIYTQARRARKLAACGVYTELDIDRIFRAQREKCAYCRMKLTNLTRRVDHIIPLVRGGSNDPSNLQIVCTSCNSSKRAKDPIEFAKYLGMLI